MAYKSKVKNGSALAYNIVWRALSGGMPVNPILEEKALELREICRRWQVERLLLFGSSARGFFDPASSDLDFLVQFPKLSPAQHAESYFGLQEDLERLFGRSVDLVEPGPIRNPYFRQAVEQSQELIYAAP